MSLAKGDAVNRTRRPPAGDFLRLGPTALARLASAALGVGYVTVLVVLTGLGRYVRTASDDWCLIPIGRDDGFSGIVTEIYERENGRLGNGVALGAIYPDYGLISKLVPGLVLLASTVLVAVMAWLLLTRALAVPTRLAVLGATTLGGALEVALLLGKPKRYQTLYHAPTIVTHTLPIVLALAVIFVVVQLERRRVFLASPIVAMAGGLLIGTFNEAFTAVCLVTLVALGLLPHSLLGFRLRWPPIVAMGAGLLGGFVSVLLSPGSRHRQELIHSRSVISPSMWRDTLDNWFTICTRSLGSGETIMMLGAAVLVGAAVVGRRGVDGRGGQLARTSVAALLWATVASLAATFVLSYSFNGVLAGRERIWPSVTLTMLMALCWCAVLAGAALHWLSASARGTSAGAAGAAGARRLAPLGVGTALVLLIVTVGSAGLTLVKDVRHLDEQTVSRSRAFDVEDRAIRRAAARGVRQLTIIPVPIDGLYEPFYPNRRYDFPTTCVPGYYHIDAVTPPPRSFYNSLRAGR
jgi:hypothetical protein